MDQAAWSALLNYYNRVSGKIDHQKTERKFRGNVEAVLNAIPANEREELQSYWQAAKEATHPFDGTRHPAPMFLVLSNFTSGDMQERATGMMCSNGCGYVFEGKLVFTAPGEVVQSVVAHELAHGWLYAKYHSQKLPLPELTVPKEKQLRSLEAYSQDNQHEEWLVDETLVRWGFDSHLLEFWEVAMEDAPNDPSGHYELIKRRFRNNPVLGS